MDDFSRKSKKILTEHDNSDAFLHDVEQSVLVMSPLEICFTYRFIRFEWKSRLESFEPIKFSCEGVPSDQLRADYTAKTNQNSFNYRRSLQRLKFGECQI